MGNCNCCKCLFICLICLLCLIINRLVIIVLTGLGLIFSGNTYTTPTPRHVTMGCRLGTSPQLAGGDFGVYPGQRGMLCMNALVLVVLQ